MTSIRSAQLTLVRIPLSYPMRKPILISGIQPTGPLHLGNYLGALKHFAELQNSGTYSCFFFIADLHALTEPKAAKALRKNTLDLMATYLAAGLNPKKSVLFVQSAVPAHSELAWIFETLTPLGELYRMTQFKDKSEGEKSVDAGLLAYPCLMAADIALYNAAYVPVGNDQLQHLELSRTIVRRFNARFVKTFVEPKALVTEVTRLMSLDDPTKKMSKSRPAGCLFIDDSPATIKTKIMAAVTDSEKEVRHDPRKKAGISNLLLIASALSGTPMGYFEKKYKTAGYAAFKKAVADIVAAHFAPFRKKKAASLKTPGRVRAAFSSGAKKARGIAAKKLASARRAIGLS